MCDLDYIPLFLDFYDRYKELSYEERGRLVWAMLAYARGEDPVPHLTEELRRFSFSNEKDVIERTRKMRIERHRRRQAASIVANRAKYNSSESMPKSPNRSQSEPIGAKTSESEHNNNNNQNNNQNNNNNNNQNHNGRGASDREHGTGRRNEAGRPDPVGREKIL